MQPSTSQQPNTAAQGKSASRSGNASRLMANAASNYIRFAIMIAGMVLLTPYVISKVGRDDFGLWMLVLSVIGYFELLDCGFATATVKFVGQYEGAGNTEQRNRLASTLLIVYLIMATVIGLFATMLSIYFPAIFQVGDHQKQTATLVLAAMSLKVALNLPLSLFLGVLFGQQRIVAINFIRVVAYLAYLGAAFVTLSQGYGIIQLAAINAAIFVLEHLAFFAYCRLTTPELQIHLSKFDVAAFKKASTFSVFALAINIASVVLLRTDPILVSFFLPLSAVAVYALALKVAEQVLALTKQLINVFTPLVAQQHGAGDRRGVEETFLSSSKFGLASLTAISIPLIFWSSEAMELWIGSEFRAAGPILAMLVTSLHIRVLQEGASNVLAMTGRHRFVAFAGAATSILNVALTLLLIWPFGLMGVAAATLISTYVIGIGLVVASMRREYGMTSFRYYQHVAAPILVPAATQLLICICLRMAGPPRSLLELLAYIGLPSSAFVITFCVFSLTDREKHFFCHRWPRLASWSRQRAPETSA